MDYLYPTLFVISLILIPNALGLFLLNVLNKREARFNVAKDTV